MPKIVTSRKDFYLRVQSVECPYCRAPAGKPCINFKMAETPTAHRKRTELYESQQGAPELLRKIRRFTPEDAQVIDGLARAHVFFYDGPGVIMPSGRRLYGNQMRLLVSAAGYDPLKPPKSFCSSGDKAEECTGANDGTCPKHPEVNI